MLDTQWPVTINLEEEGESPKKRTASSGVRKEESGPTKGSNNRQVRRNGSSTAVLDVYAVHGDCAGNFQIAGGERN